MGAKRQCGRGGGADMVVQDIAHGAGVLGHDIGRMGAGKACASTGAVAVGHQNKAVGGLHGLALVAEVLDALGLGRVDMAKGVMAGGL